MSIFDGIDFKNMSPQAFMQSVLTLNAGRDTPLHKVFENYSPSAHSIDAIAEQRPIFVSVNRANYGSPSAVIVEFQGSGPVFRCAVMIGGNCLVVNHRAYSSWHSNYKRRDLAEFIVLYAIAKEAAT